VNDEYRQPHPAEVSLAGPSSILSGIGVAVHGSAYTQVNGGKLIVESAKLVGDSAKVVLFIPTQAGRALFEASEYQEQ